METLTIRRVALDTLHADPANARLQGECGMRVIKASLQRFGQAEPLVVQRSTQCVIGGTLELTRRVFERVVAILHQHMPHRVLIYNAREHTIRVANLGGSVSELRARSADEPAGLLVASLDMLIVDEAYTLKLPDYCSRVLFISRSESTAPELPDGIA